VKALLENPHASPVKEPFSALPDSVSVTLGVGSGPYQKTLAMSLLRAGMLKRVMNSGLYLEMQDPMPDGTLRVVERFSLLGHANRVFWAIRRRLPRKLRPRPPVMLMARLTDRLWSERLPPCTIYHGWMGLSLACLERAKAQGTITLLENPARHPRDWHQAGVEECKRFGIAPRERSTTLPAPLIRRMEREFELCDLIVVPSTLSHRSFTECGLGHKTVVVKPAVDTEMFAPSPLPRERSLFRVCFVGRVELAKGAGYLLQAWKWLALPNAELVLIGDVKPEMYSLLRTYADSTVRTLGVLDPKMLPERYRESDLFVFPSVNEGLAQVLLEAMSSGLPVVASDHSGADELVTEGRDGFIVPVRDVDRLAEAIVWCYQHRRETQAMGRAARAKMESQFTLEHYNQRQIALYRSLATAAS
jgi:glycosyltransferase involved in cell wall biosynthesis